MKVAVVGSGVVGASVAFHLAAAGATVAVADDAHAGRATYAGAGIVSSPRRAERGEADFALRLAAFAGYEEMLERIGAGAGARGGAHGFFAVVGELLAAPPGEALDELQAHLEGLESRGAYQAGTVRRLDPPATRARFPCLRDDLASVFVASTGRVDGEALRLALLTAARRSGATLERGPAQLDLDGSALRGIVVGGWHLPADAVVVAAGAWSGEVLRPLGLDGSSGLSPQRGQIVHLALPATDTAGWPVVGPVGAEHYLLSFPGGRVVVGATRETGSGFDARATAGGVAEVLRDALTVAPGLSGATLGEVRVGLRPASVDGLPVLGPVPGCDGLFVATGMGATGLTIGPYCGELVAGSVLGRPTAVDLSPFAIDRPGLRGG